MTTGRRPAFSDNVSAVRPAKPPREHQFKPGQCGNPGGRPKGASVTAEIRRLMATEHSGPAFVVLNVAPPKVIGEPDIDRAAPEERSRQIKELAAQAPPNSKVVVGDCWLKA